MPRTSKHKSQTNTQRQLKEMEERLRDALKEISGLRTERCGLIVEVINLETAAEEAAHNHKELDTLFDELYEAAEVEADGLEEEIVGLKKKKKKYKKQVKVLQKWVKKSGGVGVI